MTDARPLGADEDSFIAVVRSGDTARFALITERHRRELQVHCYRMLVSLQDAEDVLQDTLLAAWQGLGGFEERASLRTWLYRIATNRCLNARRSASRRPAQEWNIPGVDPLEPTRLGEVVWLEPFPDALLEGLPDVPPGPEARYVRTESVSLAFVTALQLLPPRIINLKADPSDAVPFPHRHHAGAVPRRQRHFPAPDAARVRLGGIDEHIGAGDHDRSPAIAQQQFDPANARRPADADQPHPPRLRRGIDHFEPSRIVHI
jgi:RNA polymerase sigma factor (sigma-70 family)